MFTKRPTVTQSNLKLGLPFDGPKAFAVKEKKVNIFHQSPPVVTPRVPDMRTSALKFRSAPRATILQISTRWRRFLRNSPWRPALLFAGRLPPSISSPPLLRSVTAQRSCFSREPSLPQSSSPRNRRSAPPTSFTTSLFPTATGASLSGATSLLLRFPSSPFSLYPLLFPLIKSSPLQAPTRNHPLLLLSGVGTNAIGYDLSPGVNVFDLTPFFIKFLPLRDLTLFFLKFLPLRDFPTQFDVNCSALLRDTCLVRDSRRGFSRFVEQG